MFLRWTSAGTSIYDAGDIPAYIQPQPNITVERVVEELYTLRNCIAHGDKVPNEFFERKLRQGVNGELSLVQVFGASRRHAFTCATYTILVTNMPIA